VRRASCLRIFARAGAFFVLAGPCGVRCGVLE